MQTVIAACGKVLQGLQNEITKLKKTRVKDSKAIRRVLLLLIYNFAKILSPKVRLTDIQQEIFINFIIQSGLLNGNHITVQNKFTEWKYSNAKYNIFAQELDGFESVFLLPYEINHYK